MIRYPPDDAREWINRARSNLCRAEARMDGVYLADLCYDAQQAAEKAIKAMLIVRNVRFPYVHDLKELLQALELTGTVIPAHIRAAAELTEYALELRYPNKHDVSESAYTRAVEIARDVVSWAAGEIERGDVATDAVRELPPIFYTKAPPEGGGHAPDPTLLEQVVTRIVAATSPDKIILFGSAARGTMGPHSDLDVLIVKSGSYDGRQLYTATRDALGKLGVAFDLVIATPETLERYGHSWALVYRPALEEGRVLYDATT